MSATIYSISEYDNYAYETTTIDAADNWVKVYSDSVNKGNSKVKKFDTPTLYGFDCEIKKGDPHPYCVMLNWITINEFQGLDLSQYKYLNIHGTYSSPSELDFIRISLRQFDMNYSQMYKNHTYKFNLIEIKRKDFDDIMHINLTKLSVPFWWITMMKGNKVDSLVDITNVPLIEISTGTHASFGTHKIRITKFVFFKEIISKADIYEYILFYWGAFIFLLLTITSIYFSLLLIEKNKDENNLKQLNFALSARSSELEIINKTDELTGVFNRAGMHSKMVECINENTLPITVVMIDIDHFKKINDNFGHQSGDKVLEKFGELLNNFIVSDESVSRFGGEEFLILMPNKSTNEVLSRLEDLRYLIETTDMNIGKKITASMGVATSFQKIEFQKLIGKADNALYVAKNNGRNCVKQGSD
ncbi:MAG: GGDEF domain-containing protein [Saccharospirillaceae bacterium]|nr:GGDEF domain-containing protein [Pseudomonadales bacterium]NRB79018.1 GGDEF domain-containing protein [Saccharospirillaceae bacterium]